MTSGGAERRPCFGISPFLLSGWKNSSSGLPLPTMVRVLSSGAWRASSSWTTDVVASFMLYGGNGLLIAGSVRGRVRIRHDSDQQNGG
jgi:hypothetical protein